ncbi:MAG TPA: Gfo/Idh/MocA family oxidoreductase, partial [Planctomycetota bacterium]|nr:Gfo/Idh/MocA family oxidoreductase [Planctomycetota bacterium]
MKWALIGCGDLANKRVASALKRARNSELLCVFARNPENTAAFAQRHGIRQVCASFDDVLRQGIDAVYICTPPATHADYAIRAMQAGKHVLVEKPMASNATECRAMLACADKCGMRLGVAYYRRTHPKTLKIKELIDQGILGTPTWVNVVCHSWYAPSKDATNAWRVRPGESGGAGALADIGVHRLDLLDYWFGPLKPRYCNSHRLVQDYDVEDGTSAVLELNNGAPVHLYFAWNSKTWMDRIEIVGSEAKLIADPLDSPSLKILRGREWEELTLPPPENAHLPCVEDFITAAEAGRDALSSGRAAARTNLLLESLVGGSRAPQLSSWGRPAPIAVGIGLVPKPHNDFPEFIRTYFERCRERNPLIEANTGKWTSEDLIPGLSDFDTRFIVADSTAAQDWCRMSMDVAR